MPQDENTFDIDFGLTEEEEVIEEKIFESEAIGKKSHLILPYNAHAPLRIIHFKCVADSNYSKGSKFRLCNLPPSHIRLLGYMSKISSNIKNFKVGWSPFKNRRRESREGMEDGILDKPNGKILGRTNLESTVFDSSNGVEIYAVVSSEGKKDDYIEGILFYTKS